MELRTFVVLMFLGMGYWSCQSPSEEYSPEQGVTLELAEKRKALISDLHYKLTFAIPLRQEEEIAARVVIGFQYEDDSEPVVLDFREHVSKVKGVVTDNREVSFRLENGHLILPPGTAEKGHNEIEIEFVAGELSLNRSDEYLYTLLVPDRASTVFPCFDQPNLKARFELTLETPEGWEAMSNGKVIERRVAEGRQTFHFSVTQPISTYVFAFTSGKFKVATRVKGTKTMTLHYRETDTMKVNRNLDAIFELHASALEWLEAYTGIPYPFDKFDFTTIPTFQYGGMEHVGAIFYREPSLFLDENATDNQLLGRASLIAHETAHMWFGDLVTMDWFNDVWLKEVFANFMAAKIVNPSFPKIDHELRFLMNHQPTAYTEDRTPGTHPIQQPLENLRDAGTLYGRIIYQKAPVVMHQLESIIGEDQMREGLREYLDAYAFGNATWDDLIRILDGKSEENLEKWSEVWVKEGGMPEYEVNRLPADEPGGGSRMAVTPINRSENGNYWKQETRIIALKGNKKWSSPVEIGKEEIEIQLPITFGEPDFILANGSQGSYGYFALDDQSREWLMNRGMPQVDIPLVRGSVWMTLYEEVLRGRVAPRRFVALVAQALPGETEPLTFQYLLGRLSRVYWQFLDQREREELIPDLEKLLWTELQASPSAKRKVALWRTYQGMALTPKGVERMIRIWSGDQQVHGLSLSERDMISLVGALAIRNVSGIQEMLRRQEERIQNPDRRRRFQFVKPALSTEQAVRDSFFESLRKAENRHYEPWVADALSYLHHPLRADSSLKYLRPSLELMEEIQQTGDIFFPKRWISAILGGHQSSEAARLVRDFLAERPDYPYRLKNKILQAADLLFRSSEWMEQDFAQ